ncbi:SDR family oxidoreductase, partial [Bacillus cereus]
MCNKRWVIITGGTSGIGKQVTIDFAQNGDNIIFTYRNKKDVAIKLAKSLVENYRIECIPVHLDLNNMESVNGFIQVIEDKKINVDILINNAATFLAKDCKEINSDLWDFLMIQNAKSPLLLTVGIVKKFMGNGGSIVNISSISSS